MPLTTILFDFFGTLVHYRERVEGDGFRRSHAHFQDLGGTLEYEPFLAAWQEHFDRVEAEACESHVEYPLATPVSAFFDTHGVVCDQTDAYIETFIEDWNAGVVYDEAIHGAVRELARAYRLAVVTNTHLEWLVPRHLERMGIAGEFEHVVTSCGLGKRKPHAEIFRHVLELMGVAPADALFVGDSFEADYCGALGAGIRALIIDPEGRSAAPEESRLGSVAALPGWLAGRAR